MENILLFNRLIKKNRFQGFSLQLVRKFAHSILQCLDALYRNKIIHCGRMRNTFVDRFENFSLDLKPENILLKQQGRSGIKGMSSMILLKTNQSDYLASF